MPAASRPGTSTKPSNGPPSPDASIRRKAPAIGEPRRVLTAAKLPAAATTVIVCCGASGLARRTTRAASPPPMAIRGASGPSTAPSAKVVRAARTTPGISAASGAPPAWNPSAGEWPPRPGRYRMVRPTKTPDKPTSGIGHQIGVAVKAEPFGR